MGLVDRRILGLGEVRLPGARSSRTDAIDGSSRLTITDRAESVVRASEYGSVTVFVTTSPSAGT